VHIDADPALASKLAVGQLAVCADQQDTIDVVRRFDGGQRRAVEAVDV